MYLNIAPDVQCVYPNTALVQKKKGVKNRDTEEQELAKENGEF